MNVIEQTYKPQPLRMLEEINANSLEIVSTPSTQLNRDHFIEPLVTQDSLARNFYAEDQAFIPTLGVRGKR